MISPAKAAKTDNQVKKIRSGGSLDENSNNRAADTTANNNRAADTTAHAVGSTVRTSAPSTSSASSPTLSSASPTTPSSTSSTASSSASSTALSTSSSTSYQDKKSTLSPPTYGGGGTSRGGNGATKTGSGRPPSQPGNEEADTTGSLRIEAGQANAGLRIQSPSFFKSRPKSPRELGRRHSLAETPWHIPQPRPQSSNQHQQELQDQQKRLHEQLQQLQEQPHLLGSAWHPLNFNRFPYPPEVVPPRLDLGASSPFIPANMAAAAAGLGMGGGVLPLPPPQLQQRFPVGLLAPFSSSFHPLALPPPLPQNKPRQPSLFVLPTGTVSSPAATAAFLPPISFATAGDATDKSKAATMFPFPPESLDKLAVNSARGKAALTPPPAAAVADPGENDSLSTPLSRRDEAGSTGGGQLKRKRSHEEPSSKLSKSPSDGRRVSAKDEQTSNQSLKARILHSSPTTTAAPANGSEGSEDSKQPKLDTNGSTVDVGRKGDVSKDGTAAGDGEAAGDGHATGEGEAAGDGEAAENRARAAGRSKAAGDADKVAEGQLRQPAHFNYGSLIQLADGSMKKVEELKTEDFLASALSSQDVKIDQSLVVKLEPLESSGTVLITFSVGKHQVQVRVEAGPEHPFYVFRQGWSSVSPALTRAIYNLPAHPLNVGDVCISLTHKKSNGDDRSSPSLLMPPPANQDGAVTIAANQDAKLPLQVGLLPPASSQQDSLPPASSLQGSPTPASSQHKGPLSSQEEDLRLTNSRSSLNPKHTSNMPMASEPPISTSSTYSNLFRPIHHPEELTDHSSASPFPSISDPRCSPLPTKINPQPLRTKAARKYSNEIGREPRRSSDKLQSTASDKPRDPAGISSSPFDRPASGDPRLSPFLKIRGDPRHSPRDARVPRLSPLEDLRVSPHDARVPRHSPLDPRQSPLDQRGQRIFQPDPRDLRDPRLSPRDPRGPRQSPLDPRVLRDHRRSLLDACDPIRFPIDSRDPRQSPIDPRDQSHCLVDSRDPRQSSLDTRDHRQSPLDTRDHRLPLFDHRNSPTMDLRHLSRPTKQSLRDIRGLRHFPRDPRDPRQSHLDLKDSNYSSDARESPLDQRLVPSASTRSEDTSDLPLDMTTTGGVVAGSSSGDRPKDPVQQHRPAKQVGFNSVTKVFRIDTDSPPSRRLVGSTNTIKDPSNTNTTAATTIAGPREPAQLLVNDDDARIKQDSSNVVNENANEQERLLHDSRTCDKSANN